MKKNQELLEFIINEMLNGNEIDFSDKGLDEKMYILGIIIGIAIRISDVTLLNLMQYIKNEQEFTLISRETVDGLHELYFRINKLTEFLNIFNKKLEKPYTIIDCEKQGTVH